MFGGTFESFASPTAFNDKETNVSNSSAGPSMDSMDVSCFQGGSMLFPSTCTSGADVSGQYASRGPPSILCATMSQHEVRSLHLV